MVDSHVVLTNNTQRSHVAFTRFPLMVTSWKANMWPPLGWGTLGVSTATGTPRGAFIAAPPPPPSSQPWTCYCSAVVLSFQEHCINAITLCVAFQDWLFSLVIPWRFVPFLAEKYSTAQPSTGHLGCFQFEAITTSLLHFTQGFLCEC